MESTGRDRLKAILDEAIGVEEAAYRLYDRALTMVKDESARAVLTELRDEELLHKEMLETLDFGSWDLTPEDLVKKEVSLSDFSIGGEIGEDADLQAVLLFAVKKEEGARDFYSGVADMTTVEKEKDFFLKLAQMEEKHRKKCEALYWETYHG